MEAKHLVNLDWINFILYGINGDMETWLCKIEVNTKQNHKYTLMIFIYEHIV